MRRLTRNPHRWISSGCSKMTAHCPMESHNLANLLMFRGVELKNKNQKNKNNVRAKMVSMNGCTFPFRKPFFFLLSPPSFFWQPQKERQPAVHAHAHAHESNVWCREEINPQNCEAASRSSALTRGRNGAKSAFVGSVSAHSVAFGVSAVMGSQ